MDPDENNVPEAASACKRRKTDADVQESENSTVEINVVVEAVSSTQGQAEAMATDTGNNMSDSQAGSVENNSCTKNEANREEQKVTAPTPSGSSRPPLPVLGFCGNRAVVAAMPHDADIAGLDSNTIALANLPVVPTFNQRLPRSLSYRRINALSLDTLSDSDTSTERGGVFGNNIDLDDSDDDDNDNDYMQGFDAWSTDSSSISTFVPQSDTTDSLDDDEEIASGNNLVNNLMQKTKPPYTFNVTLELMEREHNVTNQIGCRRGHTSSQSFCQGFYGSRHVVEQMTLLSRMNGHQGCVNCLNFNRAGDLLCSGSDDRCIVIWDWANKKPLYRFKSGHNMNIFQAKFIDSVGCLDIVSSGRDGQVMRAVIPPSGGTSIKTTRLYVHTDSVHKIVVVPQSRHEIMSAGADGNIMSFDLRAGVTPTSMLRCLSARFDNGPQFVRLFSIAHHPYASEFCVCGSDDRVRVYDKRRLADPVHLMTPGPKEGAISQITCAVYNYSGSEILASYKDSGIYLYDSHNCKGGKLHCYKGHLNSRTIKGVNFFGPQSEYVVTGSDCGHIFFYDKNTEAIINFMKGDHAGVVNCLEPHPWMPVLATSGLEHDVKIWTPSGTKEHPYNPTALKKTLTRNLRQHLFNTVDHDMDHFHLLIRQFIESNTGRSRRGFDRYEDHSGSDGDDEPQLEFQQDSSSSGSSSPILLIPSQSSSSSSDDTDDDSDDDNDDDNEDVANGDVADDIAANDDIGDIETLNSNPS